MKTWSDVALGEQAIERKKDKDNLQDVGHIFYNFLYWFVLFLFVGPAYTIPFLRLRHLLPLPVPLLVPHAAHVAP